MKLILINCLIISSLFGVMQFSSAEETLTEKAEASIKTGKRSAKKAVHRSKEAICGKMTGDNKVQCLAKEAKNRMTEAKDSVQDKASELKNNIDSEKK